MYGGNRFAPVKEGDEIDVKIEALGDKGDGIAKKDGFVLVIPGTQVNDEVRVRVTKVLRRVGFAEVVGKSEGTSEEPAAEEETTEEVPEEPAAEEETTEEVPEEPAAEEEATEEEEPKDSEDFGEELEEK